MTNKSYFYGTGRRKTSIARVQLQPGPGQVVINGKPMQELFARQALQMQILEPFRLTNMLNKFSVAAKVIGGGTTGQAGAIRHGIARALAEANETLRPILRKGGLLTRDPRMKERKKYGLKRARKAPQYTKR
ncbi:MAG: 30S ribosomal protein S9 [Chloroflexi bacterium]|nr:30S ribosomal protein S9 [Chloroflexota bacterium]MDA8188543.1 30S ribosomal protein S9 [Dehalococcoidales bacterium]